MRNRKLVVVDLWGSYQHQNINQKYIDYLEKFIDIKLIGINNILHVSNLNSENINILVENKDKNKLINRFKYLRNIFMISRYITNNDKEIFVLCYDIISFILFYLLNFKKRIILFQHQHIKEIEKLVHKLIFKLYANRVEHIILEEKFKIDFLKKINLSKTKIHVCHHPLFISNSSLHKKNYNKKSVISISNSYDEERMHTFIKNIKNIDDINFYIRNKKEVYSSKNIKIEYKKYSSNELEALYKKANIVVVMVNEKNFINRISGTIFDGLSNDCFIYSNRIEISEILNKKYPYIIEIYDSIEELILKLKNKNFDNDKKQFLEDLKKFKEDYSDKKIILELKEVFDKV